MKLTKIYNTLKIVSMLLANVAAVNGTEHCTTSKTEWFNIDTPNDPKPTIELFNIDTPNDPEFFDISDGWHNQDDDAIQSYFRLAPGSDTEDEAITSDSDRDDSDLLKWYFDDKHLQLETSNSTGASSSSGTISVAEQVRGLEHADVELSVSDDNIDTVSEQSNSPGASSSSGISLVAERVRVFEERAANNKKKDDASKPPLLPTPENCGMTLTFTAKIKR